MCPYIFFEKHIDKIEFSIAHVLIVCITFIKIIIYKVEKHLSNRIKNWHVELNLFSISAQIVSIKNELIFITNTLCTYSVYIYSEYTVKDISTYCTHKSAVRSGPGKRNLLLFLCRISC